MNIKFHCQAFLRYLIFHSRANIILHMKKRFSKLLFKLLSNYTLISSNYEIWYSQMQHRNIDAGAESFSYYQKCNFHIIQNSIM